MTNCLRNSRRLLSQHHQARLLLARPSQQVPTSSTRFHHITPQRQPDVWRSIPAGLSSRRVIKHRRCYCCTSSPPSPARCCRWYHDPRKVAALSALATGAALMAFRHRYLEFVPCTNRAHFVVASPRSERELGESDFAEYKEKMASHILDPLHPDSVRVRLIARKIIHAAYRGLGVMDHDDAVMLRVTTNLDQAGKALGPRPQTTHLRGLDWDVILVADSNAGATAMCMPGGKVVVYTGLLDDPFTDDDIATVIAHEVGHIIARQDVDIASRKPLRIFRLPHSSQRMEAEADYIGLLLLGAAGFEPHIARAFFQKTAKMREGPPTFRDRYLCPHPLDEERSKFLSQPNVLGKALELYREYTVMNILANRYFR